MNQTSAYGLSREQQMRRTMIMVAAVLALVALPAAEHGGDAVYAPDQFEAGPEGGDQFNLIQRGDDGRITIVRAYPVPSVISCGAAGGFSTYRITHTAAEPVGHVSVAWSQAAVDQYTFATVSVKDVETGAFIGSHAERGPIVNTGHFDVEVDWPGQHDDQDPHSRDLQIDFGVQLTSACPSADAGTMRFDSVTVSSSGPADHQH